jgi:hypothetical protein
MVRREVIRQEREGKCHEAAAIGREMPPATQTNSKQTERIQKVSNKQKYLTKYLAKYLAKSLTKSPLVDLYLLCICICL